MKRRPTLAEVAARAGTSAKTVSNVLLDRPGASASTRARVLAAAAALNYEPNLAGRGLASRRTQRIAIVVPNLFQPYFAEMAERLIDQLRGRGYDSSLILATDDNDERDAVLIDDPDVDGMIICPSRLSATNLGGALPSRPVVQLGGRPIDGLDCVVMGEFEGGAALAEHLIGGGRRRIAAVCNNPGDLLTDGNRWSGFCAVLDAHGLAHDPRLVAYGSDNDRRASGYEAMVGLLRRRLDFDAVMCMNDALAVGALRALRTHAVSVPDDVALTGFDDTDEGAFCSPSLTTVDPDTQGMAEAAVGLLMRRLADRRAAPAVVRAHARLVVRQSSRRAG